MVLGWMVVMCCRYTYKTKKNVIYPLQYEKERRVVGEKSANAYEGQAGALARDFIVPPFSVLDGR